jgi:hypothetical protein
MSEKKETVLFAAQHVATIMLVTSLKIWDTAERANTVMSPPFRHNNIMSAPLELRITRGRVVCQKLQPTKRGRTPRPTSGP